MEEPKRGGATQRRTFAWMRWFAVLATVSLLIVVLRSADLALAHRLLVRAGPMLLLALVPYVLVAGFECLGWRRLFRMMGRDVSASDLFLIRLSTEAVLLSLPGGPLIAESLKPVLLRKRCGVPLDEALTNTAVKKTLIVMAHGLYVGLAVSLGWRFLATHGARALPWIGATTAAVLLGVSLLLLSFAIGGSAASKTATLLRVLPSRRLRAVVERSRAHFAAADARLLSLLRARKRQAFVTVSFLLLGWIAESFESWFILRLIGITASPIEVMAFEAMISVMRSVAFVVPAGLGVQDLGYLAMMHALGVHDAPTLSVAFAVVKRSKEIFWIVTGYVVLSSTRERRAESVA